MAIKLNSKSFLSSSSSNPWAPQKSNRTSFSRRDVANLGHLLSNWGNSRIRWPMRFVLLENGTYVLHCQLVGFRKQCFTFLKSRRIGHFVPLVSAYDGGSVDGSPQASTSTNFEEMRVKHNQSLQGEDYSDELVQSLHDAARNIELSITEQSPSKISWFPTSWIGIDKTSWVKTLSYQASVYSLLQAASEISARGDRRDSAVNVFVHRSLLSNSAALESVIRDKLSANQPETYEWFWSKQIPSVITSFSNYIEGDLRLTASSSVSGKGNANDISLLMFALTCLASITKLGPTHVSCLELFSVRPDTTDRLMDMLIDFIPIHEAYHSIKSIGLRREFLIHFGSRAAACGLKNDQAVEEVVFWVDVIQNQLQEAIDRERIWARLTTSESIEVLERDLAIFGFFIALGRSTQSFLSENGFDGLGDPMKSFIRYLIGGSVLYYPQLSSISSYQLYVEVVCEELDWLPFSPGHTSTPKQSHIHRIKHEGPPNAEAIPLVLDVCSYWMQCFIKYSKWLESPSDVKAARFLARGHNMLMDCMEELGMLKNEMMETDTKNFTKQTGCMRKFSPEKEPNSFDKVLESVEEASIKLEYLLQELHVSSSNSGLKHLKADCSDLEKIRKLKKEAEFLEASFRAKTASLQQEDHYVDQTSSTDGAAHSKSNEIHRFELLRNELLELENRVQRSTDQLENDDAIELPASSVSSLVQARKKENIIEKSIYKLKQASTDVWQGTHLLALDVAAAMELLRRVLLGDKLTGKEKKSLRRTLVDLASVVPISILMLLPVTAVGHAAILAAIKRYVPALIPSTYGSERLNLLRQLEKLKEIEKSEVNPSENGTR